MDLNCIDCGAEGRILCGDCHVLRSGRLTAAANRAYREAGEMNETLCENCNANAFDSPKVSIVFEGGRSVDGVSLGRSVFAHQLCDDCCEAVAHLDFAAYIARHEARPRSLELP